MRSQLGAAAVRAPAPTPPWWRRLPLIGGSGWPGRGATVRAMADSGAALLTGGLFSLAVAGISGLVAYHTARSNARAALTASRTTLEGEIRKISEQVRAQEEARERAEIAVLRQRYLTSLRYYAVALSERLAELAAKYGSDENDRVRHWFKTIKDQTTRDARRDDFLTWCYYEGLFATTTLYYACSYFFCANEIRSGQPFASSRPVYSEQLAARLGAVSVAFVWDGGRAGVWAPSQEVTGELFRQDGSKLTYAEMCGELDGGSQVRQAPYLRPLDFFWADLYPEAATRLQERLDELVRYLDAHDPRDE